ncbi:MAG: type IX secretion system membrane protein PorP/SprF [Bacteroidetes bacterium]|nr:MAG: type IX secretion system membrane protein PorP/SprF [Bacteroidota bacterium]
MRKLYCLLILLTSVQGSSAQDPHFSQFYASPTMLNPALTGAGLCGGRVALNYRNQWPSIPNNYKTFAAAYDQYAPRVNSGFGIQMAQDIAGDGLLTTRQVGVSYAYRVPLGKKWNMQFAMQGTWIQRSLDFSRLYFADQIVAQKGFILTTSELLPNESINFPSLSSGAVVFSEKFFAGFSAHHMNQPYQSFYGNSGPGTTLPTRFTLHGGLKLGGSKRNVQESWTFSPNILLMLQGAFTEMNLGFYASKNGFTGGLWFRQSGATSDALILLAGYTWTNFRMGYSYDATVSSARLVARSSHEISLAYTFCSSPKQGRKPKGDICPSF